MLCKALIQAFNDDYDTCDKIYNPMFIKQKEK